MPDPQVVTYGDWANFSTPVSVIDHRVGRISLKLTPACACVVLVLGIMLAPAVGSAQESPAEPEQPNPLIEKLANALSNTKWTGSFTVTGSEGNPKTEAYEIKEAEYLGDDKWLLTARIAYGKRDVTVPIPLEIKWAGRSTTGHLRRAGADAKR